MTDRGEMPKHTKLPWYRESRDGHSYDRRTREVIIAESVRRIAVVSKRGVDTLEEAEGNAEYLLRACNNHYEMLGGLEKALEYCESVKRVGEWGRRVDELADLLRELIVKAKGD